jgi:hypothetical protein
MTELFLQKLDPLSLVRSNSAPDASYDFLVTFPNKRGGTNTFWVEVKATEEEVPKSLVADNELHRRLTLSNIPGFLLVVDVKRNKLFYGWPNHEDRRIDLVEINDDAMRLLRRRLVTWTA